MQGIKSFNQIIFYLEKNPKITFFLKKFTVSACREAQQFDTEPGIGRNAPHPIKTMLKKLKIEFLIKGCARSNLAVLSRDKSKNLANYRTKNLCIGAQKKN